MILKKLIKLLLKNSYLPEFYYDFYQFSRLKTRKESTKEKKTNVFDAASELCNELLGIYSDEYYNLSDTRWRNMDSKYERLVHMTMKNEIKSPVKDEEEFMVYQY